MNVSKVNNLMEYNVYVERHKRFSRVRDILPGFKSTQYSPHFKLSYDRIIGKIQRRKLIRRW